MISWHFCVVDSCARPKLEGEAISTTRTIPVATYLEIVSVASDREWTDREQPTDLGHGGSLDKVWGTMSAKTILHANAV